jgi:hypothetical protein
MMKAAALLALLALAGCADPGLERVDVTWETDPPPRWGLYPGYRQEIPCPKGAVYHVDVFFKGKAFTGGTVGDAGYTLTFKPAAGARDIEAEREGRDHMTIYATLRNAKGESRRLTALRIERKDDKIYFEFPK